VTTVSLLLAALLSQDPAPPAGDEAKPAAPAAAAADAPPAPAAVAPRPKGADEAAHFLKQYGTMSAVEREGTAAQLERQFGSAEANPVMPPKELDFGKYLELSAIDQARVSARHFFEDVLVADSAGMLAHCGFPFMLEDRRVDRPDDLRGIWQKALRTHRTDLLRLYDVEILTPQEMEKKYGTPPRRLQSWNWRGGGVGYLAVGNLSGHAAVIMLKQVGAAWQVVGYHD
jgi:hypothetical protein